MMCLAANAALFGRARQQATAANAALDLTTEALAAAEHQRRTAEDLRFDLDAAPL